jgi:hypothetical protein
VLIFPNIRTSRALMTSDFLDSMDQEAEKMVRAARTTDHKEAVRAFIDERKPAFSGH